LANAYAGRGVVYALKDEKDKAIADFRKVLELSNDPNLRKSVQEALKKLGSP